MSKEQKIVLENLITQRLSSLLVTYATRYSLIIYIFSVARIGFSANFQFLLSTKKPNSYVSKALYSLGHQVLSRIYF